MKKILSLMLLAAVGFMPATAQDDDVYFVPSKSSKTPQKDLSDFRSQAERISAEENNTYAKLYEVSDRDIDAYNRRYTSADTIDSTADDYADTEEGSYTRRLVRFHSPTVGVYVSSPYYDVVADYYWYAPWFSPWYYSPFYGPSYAWTWSPWAYDWYWGWGWHTWWHDPWHYHHHHHWYDTVWRPSFNGRPGNGRYIDTYRRVTADRPSRNYNYASGSTTSRARPSRNYNSATSTADRAGRRFGNSSNSSQRSSRSFSGPGSNQSTQRNYGTTPSRSMGNSSVGSRSFGGGGSSVGSGHSMGGGSRSMGGGGGGRSFGGRR